MDKPINEKPGLSFVEPKPRPPFWKTILKIFAILIGGVIFVYLFLNSPALYAKAKYLLNPPKEEQISSQLVPEIKKYFVPSSPKEILDSFLQTTMTFRPIKNLPQVAEIPEEEPALAPEPIKTTPKKTTGGSSSLANNVISIPKIGIKAPVVWNSGLDEETMLANLQRGVVHYAGTALPGQGKGPIFISGHSSYYWWDKGKYKKVFANLGRVSAGDKIQINYNNNIYTYQVYEQIVVLPEEVSVLKSVNEPVLYLMTCVPVGTNQKRLIVKARQI